MYDRGQGIEGPRPAGKQRFPLRGHITSRPEVIASDFEKAALDVHRRHLGAVLEPYLAPTGVVVGDLDQCLDRVGKVMHIAPCPFQGGTAYHVVLMVPQDKVTLLVMPDARQPVRGQATLDGMHASVMPLRKGSVGIVGGSAAVVASVAGALGARA